MNNTTPQVTDALLPCPFCGGEADFYHDWTSVAVECTGRKNWPITCKVAPRTGVKDSREAAITAWNTRAHPTDEEEDEDMLARVGEAAENAILSDETWVGIGRAALNAIRGGE